MTEKKKNKKRVGSVIFRIVLILIAGLTVGIGVFSWNASGLVGNQLPMPFGFGVSVVMSPSMEPVLHTNDLVFVTEQDSYDVGDIVVYQEGKMLVIHRILKLDGENVITKGDANEVADDPIALSDIKAKLSFKIPFIGLIFKYLKTVPGTLLVLALAIFLLYRSRQKEREADQEDLDDIAAEIKRLRESLANQSADTTDAAEAAAAAEESAGDTGADADDSAAQEETDSQDPEAAADTAGEADDAADEEISAKDNQNDVEPQAEESSSDNEEAAAVSES